LNNNRPLILNIDYARGKQFGEAQKKLNKKL